MLHCRLHLPCGRALPVDNLVLHRFSEHQVMQFPGHLALLISHIPARRISKPTLGLVTYRGIFPKALARMVPICAELSLGMVL